MSVALAFDILARDRGASQTFDKVSDSAEKTGRKAELIGGILSKVGLAIGGAAAAGTLFGLKTAAGMEQARISFETMLGSAEKADAFLRDLSAFAAKTPFEFPELQTAASSLISAGVEASKVIPIMTSLGDVTSGMGTGAEGVQRATVALQQMSAAGRITGEDLNQLRDAGVPVFDLLAAATGRSKEAVAALASSGKLGKKDMESLFKALETGKGLERFNGLMEKQSASLSGIFSTLKDTVSMTLSNLVAPAIPAIKASLSAIPGLINGAVDGVKGAFAAARPAFESAAEVVKDAFEDIRFDLSDARDEIVDQLSSWAGPTIEAFRVGIETGDFSGVGAALGEAVGKALRGAVKVAKTITSALGEILNKVEWSSLAVQMGKQAPAVLLGFVIGLLNFDIGALLSTLGNHWFDVVMGIIGLGFMPAKVIAKLGMILTKVPLIGPLLKWLLDAMAGLSTGLVHAVGDFLGFLGRNFIDGFRRVFPGIGSAFAAALSLLPLNVVLIAGRVAGEAAQLVVRLAGAIKGGIGAIARAAGDLTGSLLKVFGEMVGDLAGVGFDMMRGLARGIVRGAGAVISAIRESVTDRLPGFVKKALGIASPSKVFAALGAQVPAGFAQGILSGSRDVARATASMTDLGPATATGRSGQAADSATGNSAAGATYNLNFNSDGPLDPLQVLAALKRMELLHA